ncbi:UDP-N-acetylmuramoyl-tripeptide--D-alanyl-D-alanine ligase [Desulfothermus naphthae]
MELGLYELGSILGSIGNYLEFQDIQFTSIKTDSRLVEKGDLFVCLQGSKMDGHSFAKDAVKKGARAIVAMKMLRDLQGQIPIIMVRDTEQALLTIAKHLRFKFKGKVIGVTGSCGKTSTKELIYSILSIHHNTGKNFKNWNNHIGIPLSIFKFTGKEDFWVLELGINYKNEMDKLGEVVAPDIACIPNIGPVHLEGLGSVKGVAKEKAKLLDFVRPGGFAVINRDYPELVEEVEKRNIKIVYVGDGTKYNITYNGLDKDMFGEFTLNLDETKIDVVSPLNLSLFDENILIASTIAYKLGIDIEDIKKGISQVKLPEHRNKWLKINDFLILDDCYNANPIAMEKLFLGLSKVNVKKPLIAILGDMLELGDASVYEHQNLGKLIGKSNVDILFYKGDFFEYVKNGLLSVSQNIPIYEIKNIEDVLNKFKALNIYKGTIVAKASRGIKLEDIIRDLIQKIKNQG